MIYAAVYKPSQWKASLQIITGIRRIGENLNKEYSVCPSYFLVLRLVEGNAGIPIHALLYHLYRDVHLFLKLNPLRLQFQCVIKAFLDRLVVLPYAFSKSLLFHQ